MFRQHRHRTIHMHRYTDTLPLTLHSATPRGVAHSPKIRLPAPAVFVSVRAPRGTPSRRLTRGWGIPVGDDENAGIRRPPKSLRACMSGCSGSESTIQDLNSESSCECRYARCSLFSEFGAHSTSHPQLIIDLTE